jgi:TonB family protein
MSYRTIALASCLFGVACGGAAPPPTAAPPPPGASKSAADKAPSPAAPAATEMTPTPPARATTESGGSLDGASKDKKSIAQAAVAAPEPLAGKLTQDDIRRILEKNGDVFGDCYTLGAGSKSKNFTGVVTVKATIGPSGAVNQVDITKSTTKNLKVDACVRDAFKKIKFPRPHDGGTSVITFPIAFNGVEQVQ